MATMEVITMGGGGQLINVLNAVAAWCGGGGYRGLLQVVLVLGLAYALITMAMHLNWKVLYNWFISSVLMYSALIVPTTTVVVIDKINPTAGNGAVANVPIGLAAIASFTSQANYWLTTTAETVFNVPGGLNMSTYGMVYPVKLLDSTRQYAIDDPVLKTNIEEYINSCYFLAYLQNPQPTVVGSFSDLVHGNIMANLGPGSPARFTMYVGSDGQATNKECDVAYPLLVADVNAWSASYIGKVALGLYPDIHDAAAAAAKLRADMKVVTGALYGNAMNAEDVVLQRGLTDAFNEAQANLGGGTGNTFAAMRANTQAKNEMALAGRQALTWVPTLELVLTIVFYAMFPLIFPMMLLPGGGVQILKGYIAGFFYLISWGSVSAVLHMFVIMRAASVLSSAAGTQGLTIATMSSLDGLNSDTAALAGYLMMSVPVIAGGLAKGAMSLSHSAVSMLSPVQSGASAAALERTTGSYSYGNVTANQFNTAPTHVSGYGMRTVVGADGVRTTTTADGSSVYDSSGAMSRLPFATSQVQSEMTSLSTAAAEFHNDANGFRRSAGISYQFAASHANSVISGYSTHRGSEGGKVDTVQEDHRKGGTIGQRTDANKRAGYDVSDGSVQSHGHTLSKGNSQQGGLVGNASLVGSTPGAGGVGGIGGKASAGIQASATWSRDSRDNEATSFNKDSKNSAGESGSSSTYKVGDETWSFSDSGVTRNGSFYRYDRLGESRNSLEKSFREAKSLEEQATFSDEKGNRLDKVVQDSRQNGWQMTEDMSQVVASRYNALATSPKYAALGAPSLTNVRPTAYQAEVRREIIAEIMKDYALQGGGEAAAFRREVEGAMQPAEATLPIPTMAQMQAARASLGANPKAPAPLTGKGGKVSGANPQGALRAIEAVNKGIAIDTGEIQGQIRQTNQAVGSPKNE